MLGGRIIHIWARNFDFFPFSLVFSFYVRPLDLLGYWEALRVVLVACCWLFDILFGFCLCHLLGWCHGAWNTSLCYSKSRHRHWRTMVYRFSILRHYAFTENLNPLENFFPLPPGALFYRCYGRIPPLDSFATRCRLYALASFIVHSVPRCSRSARALSFCLSFSVWSCWCSRSAMFRSARASSCSCYSQLWISVLYPGVAQSEESCLSVNSFRLPATLQMWYASC